MRRILAVMGLLTLLLAGCGDDGGSGDDVGADGGATTTTADESAAPAAEPFEWDVTSVDFGYELSTAEVPAGPVDVVQTNEGGTEHQVTILRLDEGQTPEQLTQLIADEGDDALDPSVFAGGANSVPAGESNSAVVDLAPGEYVTYCFIPTHAQQGMVEPFSVTGEAPADAVLPAGDTTVGLENFAFDVPDDFTGQGTVEVTNNGDQAHELTILRADQTGAGGLATIAPGATASLPLDLEPGDYTFVCFVTDPESGQIHLQLGMQAEVTVT